MARLSKTVLNALLEIAGPERVLTAADVLSDYCGALSGDETPPPALAIRPARIDDLGRIVRVLADSGLAISARGAGLSPDGPRPPGARGAVLDLADLDRIVEINDVDRYVTVEAGCTWAALEAALRVRGLRTPYGAPRGGGLATVGGTASTHGFGHGSGLHGTLADSVQSVDVVLADGSLVETGAAAAEGRTPFLRYFGPDLTGVFLGDEGAFGIKARVTLRLLPVPGAVDYLSFAFERFEDLAEAQVALAREAIAAEQWGTDPATNDALAAAGFRFMAGLAFEREVQAVKGGMGQRQATKARTLVDGHRMVVRGGYALHVVLEGDSAKDVELKLGRARRILAPSAMKELPAGVAQSLHRDAMSAPPAVLDADGRLALPLLGLFPLARAMEMSAITDEYFVRHRDLLKQHDIGITIATSATGQAFMIEPTFRWRDRPTPAHLRFAGKEQRIAFAGAAPRAAARTAVATLRRDLALLWGAFGASTFPLGRTTDYAGAVSSAAGRFVAALKTALDPRGLMNPGALGLGQARPTAPSRFKEFPTDILGGS